MEVEALATVTAIATISVPFMSLIKKDSWSTQVRQAVSILIAFVAAAIAAAVSGVDNIAEGVAYLATARVVSETLYVQYFGKTELNASLEARGN